MEALSGIRQVASIVQQIVDAVETVRRNKEECRELAKRVRTVGALLTQLDDPDMMQNPATRDALKEMEEILRHTYELITACQDRNISYRFIMGKKQAAKLREAKEKISFQLLVFPVISHVHTTRLVRRIQNIPAQPEDAEQVGLALLFQEDVEEVVSSYSSPQHDARLGANDETGRAPAVEEPTRIPEMPLASLPWFTIFTYSQLKHATNKFSCLIGQGGFGTVYKGTLRDGLQVAVKHFYKSSLKEEFDNEVLAAKLQHINIMKLLGYCTKGGLFLVYEFMSKGSLFDHIFGTADVLPWRTRFKIVEGIAQGALYLHKHCGLRIVHSDLTPSNILLDDDWIPKIIDFGISQMLPRSADEGRSYSIIGRIGYIAPEYMHSGCFSVKIDVYSFGVMLLEIISGKKCNQTDDYNTLSGWVSKHSGTCVCMSLVKPIYGNSIEAN